MGASGDSRPYFLLILLPRHGNSHSGVSNLSIRKPAFRCPSTRLEASRALVTRKSNRYCVVRGPVVRVVVVGLGLVGPPEPPSGSSSSSSTVVQYWAVGPLGCLLLPVLVQVVPESRSLPFGFRKEEGAVLVVLCHCASGPCWTLAAGSRLSCDVTDLLLHGRHCHSEQTEGSSME